MEHGGHSHQDNCSRCIVAKVGKGQNYQAFDTTTCKPGKESVQIDLQRIELVLDPSLTDSRRQLADISSTEAIRAQQVVGQHGEQVGENHAHQVRHAREEARLEGIHMRYFKCKTKC